MNVKKIMKFIYIKLINIGAYFYRKNKYKLAKCIWTISIHSGYANNKNILKYTSLLNKSELQKHVPAIYFKLIEDDIYLVQLLKITKKRNLNDYYRKIKLSRAGDQKFLLNLIQKVGLNDIAIKIDFYKEVNEGTTLKSDLERLLFCISNNTSIEVDFRKISEKDLIKVINYCKEKEIIIDKILVSLLVGSFSELSYRAAYNISVYQSKLRLDHDLAWRTLFNLYPNDIKVVKNYIASHYRTTYTDIEQAHSTLVQLNKNNIVDNSRYVENSILVGKTHRVTPLRFDINKSAYIKLIESIRKSNDYILCSAYIKNYVDIYGDDKAISNIRLKIALQDGDYLLAKRLSNKSGDDYYRALSHLKAKDINGAVKILRKIKAGTRNFGNAQILLADIQFYELENYKMAMEYYEESRKQSKLDYQANIRFQYCKLQLNKNIDKKEASSIAAYDLDLITYSSLVETNAKLALSRLNKIYYSSNSTPLSVSHRNVKNNFFDSIYCVSKKRHRGPLVSIIMTTFKCKNTVDFAISSILNQSYLDIELIVVDDCSDDGTFEYLEEKYKNIRLFRSPINSGTYVSKNIGMKNATGDYITFMDSDDWSHPERIYKQVKALEQKSGLVACTTDHVRMYENGRLLIRKGGIATFAPISLMIRRKLIEQIGYFDSVRCSGDSEFIGRIKTVFGKNSILNIRCPMLLARQSETSLTTSGKTAITWAAMPKVRLDYKRSFLNWHKHTDNHYLPAIQSQRYFDCPREIEWNKNA